MSEQRSQIYGVADRAVDVMAAGDPCMAVVLGLSGDKPALTDYSPAGHDRRQEDVADLLNAVSAAEPGDDSDRIAAEVMSQQFRHTLAAADAGDHLRDINILASPPQHVRMALEFSSSQDCEELLDQVPEAMAGWRDSLALGLARNLPASRRQALAVSAQLNAYADDWLDEFQRSRSLPDSVIETARRAFADTSVWLADVYAVDAAESDGVGEERYLRASDAFNGIELDLDDTFAWGWDEIDRLTRELRSEADRLSTDMPLPQLREFLDADPTYQIHGTDALTAHLRDLTDSATERVDGELFAIDPRVRGCGVELAAEGAAAAPYYVPPSEDLSRPGSTWYPVRGSEVFPRWWLQTVWFHEGVPGHHLQLGAIATQSDMSRFQRVLGTTSGHAEGWALYAERLCDELGWFDEPGTRIGFLSAQLMRAVRVVVDIGLHTDRRVPRGVAGAQGRVTPRLAEQLLVDTALVEPGFAASEVDRYLGMPGQAISYKVGERSWLSLRDRAAESQPDFDLKDWHTYAMRLGPMGLAQFEAEMSRYPG